MTMRKTIYTLNINYPKQITDLTYPLMKDYAKKIGAEFCVITERESPKWPMVYEKFQVARLGREDDWSIFFDSDTLVHPALFDVTECIQKDTVMFCERDLVGNRFRTNEYFRRDGRQISACSWFVVSSDWCRDLWMPLGGFCAEEVAANIIPQPVEVDAGITAEHLIDDYIMSHNIARYGLKYKQFRDVLKDLNCDGQNYFWHTHLVPEDTKYNQMLIVLDNWRIRRLDHLERVNIENALNKAQQVRQEQVMV
jgi:hypothetical protein